MGAGGSARHDRTAIGPAALPEGRVISSSVPMPAEPSGLHSVTVQPGWAPGSHQLVALPSGLHVTIIVPPTAQPGDRLAVNPNVPEELPTEARAEAARWMAAELQQQDQLELDRKLVAAAQKGNDENVGVLLAAGATAGGAIVSEALCLLMGTEIAHWLFWQNITHGLLLTAAKFMPAWPK